MITREEERELIRRFQEEGDESARNRLVEAHKRWVFRIAGQQRARMRRRDLEIEDVAQVGLLHLMYAIGTFDLSRDVRLITFCTQGIRRSIADALRGNRANNNYGLPNALTYDRTASSLDARMERLEKTASDARDDEENTFQSLERFDIPDEDGESDLNLIEQLVWLKAEAKNLPDKQRLVIERRMRGHSCTEIAAEVGVTREAIRQLEFRAIDALRKAAGDMTSVERGTRTERSKQVLASRLSNATAAASAIKPADWKSKMAARMRERHATH